MAWNLNRLSNTEVEIDLLIRMWIQAFRHGHENGLSNTDIETGFDMDVETGFPTKTCKQTFRKGYGTGSPIPTRIIY